MPELMMGYSSPGFINVSLEILASPADVTEDFSKYNIISTDDLLVSSPLPRALLSS